MNRNDNTAAPANSAPERAAPARPRRPRELQDPLNAYLYHPLAWQLARALARTPITPNMVSVFGGAMVIGAAGCYLWGGYPGGVLAGMALHMGWHVVDGADGDLARMTGRTSPIGELVDGLCDYISHIVLYIALGWILSHQDGITHGGAGWALTVVAGISHALQANHVEVQRRQYQWWVYGTPWLRLTHGAGSATARRGAGALVAGYLALAAGMTPEALEVDAAVGAAKGDPARLAAIAAAARAEAGPLLPLCMVLGPNPRAVVLGLSMLAHSPFYYMLYQAVWLNLLLVWSVGRHNAAARRIAARLAG